VAIAATDTAGNVATRILRYLPDDTFLDNLDPQYREGQGTWTSSTNASWGTDARLALLASNSVAQAGWDLALSWSGRYHISAQVPALATAATNVVYRIFGGSTNLLSVVFPAGITTKQWVFVGSVVLDQTLSNHVEMVVSGADQPGNYAIADVLRVSPVAEDSFPVINSENQVALFPTSRGYALRFAAAQSGARYAIQRTADLTAAWSTLQIVSPGFAGLLEYEDETPLASQAFYRILAQ
jgi:hypothetical protein